MIAELQHGDVHGAAARIERIVRDFFGSTPVAPPNVALACTELALAFPDFRSLGTFVSNGIRYINPSAVHVDACFDVCMAD